MCGNRGFGGPEGLILWATNGEGETALGRYLMP